MEKKSMAEQRLINANALDVVGTIIPSDADTKSYVMGMEYILNKIDKMPTIEERKTGKWIRTRTMKHDGELYCDQCEQEHPEQMKIWNFCPYCGTKMEGERQ